MGEAAAGSGVQLGSQGGLTRGAGLGCGQARVGWRGSFCAEPERRGVRQCRAHRGEGCERCERLIRGKAEPSWRMVCAPSLGRAVPQTQQPGPSVSPGLCQSRCSSCRPQHWTLLSVSLLNCLLSTACSVGLALALALTVHGRGRHLVRGCNSPALPADARAAIATNDCPFNTTRIYVSLQGLRAPNSFNHPLPLSASSRLSFLFTLTLLPASLLSPSPRPFPCWPRSLW